MESNFNLNCLVLGDDPSRIFMIKVASTENVSAFRCLVRDEQKHAFDGVDADRLNLWDVDLPVDDALQRRIDGLDLEHKAPLSPVARLSKVFSDLPKEEHLHIVVQAPPTGIRFLYCYILGDDPTAIFSVEIAQGCTVAVLKDLIKEKNRDAFHNVGARLLLLYSTSLPMDTFEHSLDNLNLDEEQSLPPGAEITSVFVKPPKPNHVHIIVRRPLTTPVALDISSLNERIGYFGRRIDVPSTGARPAEFAKIQKGKEYLCNRPRDAATPIPVTLFESIFAEFVDDCQNRRPTADDDIFVEQISEKMSSFYTSEPLRMADFRELLGDYGIKLDAASVGKTQGTTDGHLLSSDRKFVMVIADGKNEIGSGTAEPFAEAMMYHRTFIRGRKHETRLRSHFPCFLIIVFGGCIGIAGSIATNRVHCDVLVPIIPLFWHSTDFVMQAMAARTFGALKIAIAKLEAQYSKAILPLEHQDTFLSCPYFRMYTDSMGQIHEFSYDKIQILRNRRIFFGRTVNSGEKICLKFVKHYSPEVHQFCADKGQAPKLIAYNNLAGGWNVVVMDALDIDNDHSPQRPGSYRQLSEMTVSDYQLLEEPITSLVRGLHNHNGGYVHGDLRDTNIFVRDDRKHFMLLDFDWAGPVGDTHYPMYVNWQQIQRPAGARDWNEIVTGHDLEMLSYMFRDGPQGVAQGGSTAKRRRLSSSSSHNGSEGNGNGGNSSGGSAMDV